MERQPLDFQTIIARLSAYWARQGCLVWNPYDMEKGAGTFNPATFLRALGPEPWRVAYVEPSRRPTDGRFGENPNRLQHYYQYQVILKPAPEDAQRLYIDSLRELGVDLLTHDLRFVEDDWEQPSVGAAGLGWEVWLDGQEVSQYTYFQQVGGIEVDPICVEYTYGLERIATFIQGVDSVYDITWVNGDAATGRPAVTYGDVHYQDEVQFSAFNFDHANIESLRGWFDGYEKQAVDLLEVTEANDASVAEEGGKYDPRRCLIMPAYDFVMKASHAFNLLDARNAISVDQRQIYINRVRKLAMRCAKAFIAHRRALGFPLLKAAEAATATQSASKPKAGSDRDGVSDRDGDEDGKSNARDSGDGAAGKRTSGKQAKAATKKRAKKKTKSAK